jgi:hypothetical protein
MTAGETAIILDRGTIYAIAEQAALRTVELIREAGIAGLDRQLVDAKTLARALGVSRDCVYAHAAELGGERVGGGPRGRLRFDLDQALAAWTSRSVSKESERTESPVSAGRSTRRRPRRLGSGVELLPIRGSEAPARDSQEHP